MDGKTRIEHQQALRVAFDAPWPGPGEADIILEQGPIALRVASHDGARITSLRVYGYELLRQWHSERKAFQYGCFPMVPWVGRLGSGALEFKGTTYTLPVNKPPHALHGMSCYSNWSVIERTMSSVTLQLELGEPWPWSGTVIQKIKITGEEVLLRLEIYSSGEDFPASAGWHPWFAKFIEETDSEPLQVGFHADWQEEAGENELPTGRRIAPQPGPWDDCFGFENSLVAKLEWPGKLRLEMTSNANSLVIFDKQPDAACVNAMTQAPNVINYSPDIVTAQKPIFIESRWRMTPL